MNATVSRIFAGKKTNKMPQGSFKQVAGFEPRFFRFATVVPDNALFQARTFPQRALGYTKNSAKNFGAGLLILTGSKSRRFFCANRALTLCGIILYKNDPKKQKGRTKHGEIVFNLSGHLPGADRQAAPPGGLRRRAHGGRAPAHQYGGAPNLPGQQQGHGFLSG